MIWKSMGNDNVCTVHRVIFFFFSFKFIAKTTKPNRGSERQAGLLPCQTLAVKIAEKTHLTLLPNENHAELCLLKLFVLSSSEGREERAGQAALTEVGPLLNFHL